MRRGKGDHLVIDQAHRPCRGDHLRVAEGRGRALARHDPDGPIRSDPRAEARQRGKIGRRVGGDEDHVGVGEGRSQGDIRCSLADLAGKCGIVDTHDGNPDAGAHAQLVEARCRVDPLHRGYRATVTNRRGPLLVFGPRSETYDFGPAHPLTPRRFAPALDLLRLVGAEPGLAPEPATDDELQAIHEATYLAIVRRLSEDPGGRAAAGIGTGDVPAFAGMHAAAAMVAGGSLRAMEAILHGDVEHAFHPGGGLHHAMTARAAGFCIYNDPALAIARARQEGLRVLYVDLDVHHGDGVETIHRDDPGVLTVSFHESGQYLFPGTGALDDVGDGAAAGTLVNVPFEPQTGEGGWLRAVERLLPDLAAAFGPDVIVSQHGCDSHAWDPLAHLRVTTTAMGTAARLVDRVAHRWAGGRWLSTGGGGYDAYRVVPRAWALTWLAGAHLDAPAAIPETWRRRWSPSALRHGTYPLPEQFDDAPNAGSPVDGEQLEAEARAIAVAGLVRQLVVPALVVAAVDRGWWSPEASSRSTGEATSVHRLDNPAHAAEPADPADPAPTVVSRVDAATWQRLGVAHRTLAPADPAAAHALLASGLRAVDGSEVRVTAAIVEGLVVGGVVSAASASATGVRTLLAIGVAPAWRQAGLAARLLTTHLDDSPPGIRWEAMVGVGERDVVEPLSDVERFGIAARMLERAGFTVRRMEDSGGRGRILAVLGTRD